MNPEYILFINLIKTFWIILLIFRKMKAQNQKVKNNNLTLVSKIKRINLNQLVLGKNQAIEKRMKKIYKY